MIIFRLKIKYSSGTKTEKVKKLTESTDEIKETTHITIAIFQWKTGVPHCSG